MDVLASQITSKSIVFQQLVPSVTGEIKTHSWQVMRNVFLSHNVIMMGANGRGLFDQTFIFIVRYQKNNWRKHRKNKTIEGMWMVNKRRWALGSWHLSTVYIIVIQIITKGMSWRNGQKLVWVKGVSITVAVSVCILYICVSIKTVLSKFWNHVMSSNFTKKCLNKLYQ